LVVYIIVSTTHGHTNIRNNLKLGRLVFVYFSYNNVVPTSQK